MKKHANRDLLNDSFRFWILAMVTGILIGFFLVLGESTEGGVAPHLTGMAFVAGEITTNCYVHIPDIVRETIKDIGYTRAKYGFDFETCAVITSIDKQSGDIRSINGLLILPVPSNLRTIPNSLCNPSIIQPYRAPRAFMHVNRSLAL